MEGTIGGVTFYKTKDGYLAKEKSSVSRSRMATDPAFQRTRENGAEFGRAGKAGKLLRIPFKGLLQNAADKSMTPRLTKEFMRVVKADATSTRGQRNVIDGEVELLKGFEFNENGKLAATLFAPYKATIDRATGELKVEIPSFIPGNMMTVPDGSTHFKLNMGGAAIDFVSGAYDVDIQSPANMPIDYNPTAPITLTAALPAASTHPLFLLLGIEFIQEVNGTPYALKNGAFNGLCIVEVSGV